MSSPLDSVELVLQAISTVFALLGIAVTIAGINCENSIAAIVYGKLFRKGCLNQGNTHVDVERQSPTTQQQRVPHTPRTWSCLSDLTLVAQDTAYSAPSNTPEPCAAVPSLSRTMRTDLLDHIRGKKHDLLSRSTKSVSSLSPFHHFSTVKNMPQH
ncbi:hypothetical protein M3J09_009852 [Ascochyta lentis]